MGPYDVNLLGMPYPESKRGTSDSNSDAAQVSQAWVSDMSVMPSNQRKRSGGDDDDDDEEIMPEEFQMM